MVPPVPTGAPRGQLELSVAMGHTDSPLEALDEEGRTWRAEPAAFGAQKKRVERLNNLEPESKEQQELYFIFFEKRFHVYHVLVKSSKVMFGIWGPLR